MLTVPASCGTFKKSVNKLDMQTQPRGIVPTGVIQCGLAEHNTGGWCPMALGIYFAHEGFTPEKYSSAIKQLEAAGEASRKGVLTTALLNRTVQSRSSTSGSPRRTLTHSGRR
jgi:hypothetical protein